MLNIFNPGWIFEGKSGDVEVNIFDFDNTLFKSPVPNPELWSGKFLGKLKAEIKEGGLGWYQSLLTLSPKFIDSDAFIESTVDAVRASMNNPNAVTVLLTGRTVDYSDLIKALVDRKGLVFDYVGLKPHGLRTLPFKYEFIRNVLEKVATTGNIVKVNLYEDRLEHVKKFEEHFTKLNIPHQIHFVKGGDYHMPEAKEKELVDLLNTEVERIRGHKVPISNNSPRYYGVVLSEESRNKLLSLVPNIPDGWKVIAHHCTLVAPDKIALDTKALNYAKENLNKTVTFKVIALGKNDNAMAVVAVLPSTNKTPHITVAVSPTGKPKDSNEIDEWVQIDSTELSGVVKGLF